MSTNIFEIIEKVTSRIEPFHSEFLVNSFRNDRELLNKFIFHLINKGIDKLIQKFIDAEELIIKSEDSFEDYRRIDITIQEPISMTIIGIEVKTSDSSVSKNQLSFYYNNILQKYPDHDVIIVFLTPFNHENIPKEISPNLIRAIAGFVDFNKLIPNSIHINWKELVNLYNNSQSNENSLYTAHKEYITSKVTNESLLMRRINSLARNRGLAEFLGETCMETFFDNLFNNNIISHEDDKKIIFNIGENINNYESLIDSFEILIDSEKLQKTSKKQNKVQEYLTNQYEHGSNGDFFKQFFSFINNYSYLWLEGTGRIGVRASHTLHPSSGVSLFTLDEDNVVLYKNR
jgi:hypothetical protein